MRTDTRATTGHCPYWTAVDVVNDAVKMNTAFVLPLGLDLSLDLEPSLICHLVDLISYAFLML